MTASRDLARELAGLKKRVRHLETAASLSDSSIEGGFTPVYDDDGTIRQIIGAQVDGTFTSNDVNGPAPVAPAEPTIETQPGLLVISSFGLTSDLSDWPLDFLRIDVHVGTSSGFTPTAATKVAEWTADGGSVTLALAEDTYYVVLVAVNTSGNQSEPSAEATGTVLAATIGSSGVKTYYTDDAPVGLLFEDDGSLWYETDNGNLPHRWDGATLTWIPLPLGGGGLTSDAIDGMTIVGATFIAHDALGNVTAMIDGTTGNVTTQGEFGTAPPGAPGIHISSNEFDGIYGQATYPTIEFNNGNQGVEGNRQPQIFTDTTGASNLYAWGGGGDQTRMGQMKLDSGKARLGIEDVAGTEEVDGERITCEHGVVTIASDGIIQITNNAQDAFGDLEMQDLTLWGKLEVVGSGHVTGHLNVDAEVQCDGTFQTSASGGFQFTGAAGGDWKDINTGAVHANGHVTGTQVFATNPDSTTASANTHHVGSGGQYQIVASLSALKLEQEEIALADSLGLLDLTPITWYDRAQVEAQGGSTEGLRRIPGVTAEDVAEHAPAFALYDEQGELSSVAYDRMVVATIPLLRDLFARVEALEAK